MNSHEIDYQIKGESIQIVEVELDPMETVIAEAGAMLFMEDVGTAEFSDVANGIARLPELLAKPIALRGLEKL